MDDDTGSPVVESPPETQEERGPETAPPPPTIEAFVQYRDRVQEDAAAGGRIGKMMMEYADAQSDERRAELDNDIDVFTNVWDKFAAAFPPPPDPPPQAPPPAPREYKVPEWQRQRIEREASRKTSVLDSTFSIGPGMMPEPGTAERVEAKQFNREVNDIRRAIRENPGERDLEYRLAEKLFGDAKNWKPDHGPEHG